MPNRICRIIIPDTGLLISLERADLLWTLVTLEKELIIPLAVLYELDARTVENPSPLWKAQAAKIKSFLDDFGVLWLRTRSSIKMEQAIFNLEKLQYQAQISPKKEIFEQIWAIRKSVRHAGENGIVEIIDYIFFTNTLSSPVLILYEDKRIPLLRIAVPDLNDLETFPDTMVHLVGIRGFLLGLERMGIIDSAKDAINTIESKDESGVPRFIEDNKENEDLPSVGGSKWKTKR